MDWSDVFTAIGLGVITLVTRCFFFISDRELPFRRAGRSGGA
jgi:hypothetical protein